MLEIVAEHLVDALQVQPVHEAGLRVEHRLAAEVLPALELVGVLGRRRHHRFHRIGVPGVHELGLGRLEVLEAADALVELGHADVGGVGDLAFAVHHRLHGDGRGGIRLHGDGVFAAQRLLDDLRHRGGDRVAVGTDLRRGPAQRLALLRLGRLQRRDRQHGGEGGGGCGERISKFHLGHRCFLILVVVFRDRALRTRRGTPPLFCHHSRAEGGIGACRGGAC